MSTAFDHLPGRKGGGVAIEGRAEAYFEDDRWLATVIVLHYLASLFCRP